VRESIGKSARQGESPDKFRSLRQVFFHRSGEESNGHLLYHRPHLKVNALQGFLQKKMKIRLIRRRIGDASFPDCRRLIQAAGRKSRTESVPFREKNRNFDGFHSAFHANFLFVIDMFMYFSQNCCKMCKFK
jgi:hypothetical protein